MRLLVGCTLEAGEIEAIERGEALREQVEKRLAKLPLAPLDAKACGALELLAWMIDQGHLEVKVAVLAMQTAGRFRTLPSSNGGSPSQQLCLDAAWDEDLSETIARRPQPRRQSAWTTWTASSPS